MAVCSAGRAGSGLGVISGVRIGLFSDATDAGPEGPGALGSVQDAQSMQERGLRLARGVAWAMPGLRHWKLRLMAPRGPRLASLAVPYGLRPC